MWRNVCAIPIAILCTMNLRWTSVGINLYHFAVKPTGNCQLWQFRCAVHTRCSSDCDLIASCYSCVPLCIQPDVGIVLVRILSQNYCLLLLAATLLYVQAVTSVGSINTTDIPTKSGHQQLSHTIMTPHLNTPHIPLSFQLTICLTQYTQSVQSN